MIFRKKSIRQVAGLQALLEIKVAFVGDANDPQVASKRTEQAEQDHELFIRSVGPVTPLKASARLNPVIRKFPLPEPLPFQRERDEAAVMSDAFSDGLDIEALLETDENLSFSRPHLGPDVVKRLRRGVWAIESHIDLHGLRRDEAREALSRFLRWAIQKRIRCVRIIHGKGYGSPGRVPVLKDKVKRWLVQKEEVMAFVQARAADGGGGALVVLLRN